MRIGNRNFSPNLWPTLATVIIFPLLIALGFWQLDRAEQKREIYLTFLQRIEGEMINLNQDSIKRENVDEILWRKVMASGRFDETVQFLLDNQVVNNQAGYFVYTPFQLSGENRWFLVNRGWVPAGNDRSKIPELEKSQGSVSISGHAKKSPGTGILLGEKIVEQMQTGIYRLHRIDLAEASKLVNKDFMPYVIRLDEDSDYGYVRKWQRPGSDDTIHLGYAFQWFLLAFTLMVIYIVVNLKKIQDD